MHIQAPVARFEGQAATPLEPPSLEELYRLTHAALKQERLKSSELYDYGRQSASLALCLLKMLIDSGHPAVNGENMLTVPRWLHEEMLGASVAVGQDMDGNPTIKLVERGQQRIKAQ